MLKAEKAVIGVLGISGDLGVQKIEQTFPDSTKWTNTLLYNLDYC